ncbi:MAG: YaaA family protein [Patescibacteria group bacterium]
MPLTILLHSSKTMVATDPTRELTSPIFEEQANELTDYIQELTPSELEKVMHISSKLAVEVEDLYYTRLEQPLSAAAEMFRGDIYSGLRSLEWNDTEKDFAQKHLKILSGLYGVLRPFDGIQSYRLELGYRLPDPKYKDLYNYWSDRIAESLPTDGPIINVTSDEYAKAVLPFLNPSRIITPVFLTQKGEGKEPVFVVVHAKIARGAYARWLIKRGSPTVDGLEKFDDLGYIYDAEKSTPTQPVYVCQEFGGIGLSQRLS